MVLLSENYRLTYNEVLCYTTKRKMREIDKEHVCSLLHIHRLAKLIDENFLQDES